MSNSYPNKKMYVWISGPDRPYKSVVVAIGTNEDDARINAKMKMMDETGVAEISEEQRIEARKELDVVLLGEPSSDDEAIFITGW